MSTAERALIDIAQDRRYWIIHSITIPSLFVGGSYIYAVWLCVQVIWGSKFQQILR